MTKRKKIIVIIIAVISLAVLAGGISCTVIFWPKKPLTLQEQLNQFKASLAMITDNELDSNGNPFPKGIKRTIVIKEKDEIVVEYQQAFKIYIDNENRMTAYLSINEIYPSLETTEFNIFDEYYLSSGIMHTRRENNGEIFVSSFDSNIETFFVILSENIGTAKYDFSEDNFTAIDESASIVSLKDNLTILDAFIKIDKYTQFFGESADTSNISNVQLEMIIENSTLFNSLKLTYLDGEQNVFIRIERQDIVPSKVTEWI